MSARELLSEEHYEEIVINSGVDPDVASARGYRTLTGTEAEREELTEMGFGRGLVNRDETYPALLIPMHGADGEVRGHQIKAAVPRSAGVREDGTPKIRKYEAPGKVPPVLDVPAFTRGALREPGTAVWITEGMKKVDALCSNGAAAIGLTGVFNWRSKLGTLGDWEDIPIKAHPWVICFDADAASNRNVQLAMTRLGAWLKTKGAPSVHYVITPASVGETETKGVDDYFVAGGTLAGLGEIGTQTPPGGGAKDASFTDAYLVEEVCSGALEGRFCWSSGLGWMKWDGRVWKEVADTEPVEAARLWALSQFEGVLAEQKKDSSRDLTSQITGWRGVLAKARLRALIDLSRGIIERYAEDFDADPDLLTVQNGTLHLPTGRLLDFDPAHSITKMAGAEYREGAKHALWDKALSALPGELHPWYQDRLGQALTGYKTPDHKLVLAYGSGSNGKSTVVNTVRATIGGYGVQISDRVLMANPDAHPTELMDLRGARYAILEETPEARHLNVQRLKTTLGTETVVARRIRQDPVEFLATHSLFINSNYRPQVAETDHGTWRRLCMVTFPFTFRSRQAEVTGPFDRLGDAALEYAHTDPQVRAAALAWMVEGAKAWYARGRRMLPVPELVENDTKDWRAETDLVMGFADECLTFDREGFTPVQEVLQAFNEWSGERGHRPWNDKTFANRFGNHDVVKGAKVHQGRKYVNGKQVRVWHGVALGCGPDESGELASPFDGGPAPEAPEPESRLFAPGAFDHYASVLGLKDAKDPDEPTVLVSQVPEQAWPPVALGFDIETASADELFRGNHEGPFVRLTGAVGQWCEEGGTIGPDASGLLECLNNADVIYGHRLFEFDLMALARHCGADYDALAAKTIDTFTLSQLAWPSGAKGDKVAYDLDSVAKRLGHEGKSDDLKALAKEFGGFDKIPADDERYREYLRGDLAATRHVYEKLRMLRPEDGSSATERTIRYAEREMSVAAIQNRMTLNGWKIDTELLAQRVDAENERRSSAAQALHTEFGMPLAPPDKVRLKLKADWPGQYADLKAAEARQLEDETLVVTGLADRVPQEPYAAPWATDAGRAALVAAFAAAGAKHYPKTKTGDLKLSSEALGEGTWYDKDAGVSKPGMLNPRAYPREKFPQVGRICDLLSEATGATAKYAEIQEWLSPEGRVHARVSKVQASGRWGTTQPASANLGKRGDKVEQRRVFLADEGHVLITCDLAGVDVRAMAAHSQDPELIARLQPGMDYHSEMAEIFFGDRSRRKDGKPISHGLNYRQGVKALSERTGLPYDFVQAAVDKHKETFHVLGEWTDQLIAHAETGALLDNGFGRLMKCDPSRAYTQAPALMGQGGARDIMTESLLRFIDMADRDRLGKPARDALRGVVHDEVILSVPEDEWMFWSELLHDAFTWEWKGVPILCDVSRPGRNWAECVD